MLRLRTVCLGLLLTVSAAAFASAATFRAGTYNLRYRTLADYSDDPAANKYWDNRAAAVIQTIRDMQYDIIGLNEVTDDPRHDGRTMWQDLRAGLPAPDWDAVYAYSKYQRDVDGSYMHLIMYRTAMFELLDQGHFWLAPDQDRYSTEVWDSGDYGRMAVWGKFRVKATGEVFYYFTTHLHHQNEIAKNEGTRLVVDQARRIAGGYPCIVTGDHNSSTTRAPFYKMYTAYFDDAREVAVNSDGTLNTCNAWTTLASRLDYIFVNRCRVDDFRSSRQQYGLPFTPSDHLPLQAMITLEQPVTVRDIYVSASAPAGGDGSKAAPFNSLQRGLDACPRDGRVLVTCGTYLPERKNADIKSSQARNLCFGIDRSLRIEGGYDAGFRRIIGRSILSGDLKGDDDYSGAAAANTADNAFCVMVVADGAAAELANVEICGAAGFGSSPGGINCKGPRLTLDNCAVHHNTAKTNGAGVSVAGKLDARNSQFYCNTAGGVGGAVYFDQPNSKYSAMWWSSTIDRCILRDNTANSGSALYYKGAGWANIVHSSIYGNTASGQGTVYVGGTLTDTRLNIANSTIACNSAADGAALYVAQLKVPTETDFGTAIAGMACCTVTGNTSAAGGAAVQIVNGIRMYVHNNILACNVPFDLNAPNVPPGSESRYNLYTALGTVSFHPDNTDIWAATPESAAASLGKTLDGSVADGRFVPRLAMNGGSTPTVAVLRPEYAGRAINVLTPDRFNENVVMTDLNADMQVRWTIADNYRLDQRGEQRPDPACIGAYEYGVNSALEQPVADSPAEQGDLPVEYYNLQGLRIDNPEHGIYIRRQGLTVTKIKL